jgi:hypothetical protein
MNRRDFLANSISAAGALAARSAFAAPAQYSVTVRGDQPLGMIAPDFMGLGYEISSPARPGLLSPANKVYVQLVRTLGPRGVIRIGGNTADYAKYLPNAAPVSSAKGTVVNNAVLEDLGGFLQATGWKLIWALDLGQGTEADAIAEAKIIMSIAGEHLLAFEIGNEPDLFARAKHRNPDYGYDDWLAEYRRYKAALRKEFPRIPFAGPDAALKTEWVTRFAADEGKDSVLLTHHYYREGQNPTSSIEKLLGVDPKLPAQLTALKAASQACGAPYRICEVNSFSGGGRPGVSDTMAGALWVLDYMFTLAASGCAGVNMETGVNHLDFISSYSPIGDDEHGHYSAKPEYYGMRAFSLAGRGQLLLAENEPNSPEIKAYATKPDKGPFTITLINKGASAADVTVNLGEHTKAKQGSVIRLSGPAINAKTGITLGGAEVTPDGTWKPSKSESIHVRNGQVIMTLLPFSAAVVHF